MSFEASAREARPTTEAAAVNGSAEGRAASLATLGPGTIAEGTVAGITHFGAFVNLDGGATGLIHISEIAHRYVRDVREHLQPSARVRVKVLQANPTNGRFDLSLKQLQEPPGELLPRLDRSRRPRTLAPGADPAFEEKLSKFLKTSQERLADVKRNLESKRGGRYR